MLELVLTSRLGIVLVNRTGSVNDDEFVLFQMGTEFDLFFIHLFEAQAPPQSSLDTPNVLKCKYD